ncbi:unnamed protein product [Gordionus sp. m RMFG-2023]
MEALALHDFIASAHDELSFTKGQILKVLNMQEDPNWYKVERNGLEGYVPSNYIQMKPFRWYKGQMTRAKAENYLSKQSETGTFIVRLSESSPGDFSLTVKVNDGYQHFKILRDSFGKYFVWVVKFESINQLLDYHRVNSINKKDIILLKDCEPEQIIKVEALYDFEAKEPDEISFKKGDIISVTSNFK